MEPDDYVEHGCLCPSSPGMGLCYYDSFLSLLTTDCVLITDRYPLVPVILVDGI